MTKIRLMFGAQNAHSMQRRFRPKAVVDIKPSRTAPGSKMQPHRLRGIRKRIHGFSGNSSFDPGVRQISLIYQAARHIKDSPQEPVNPVSRVLYGGMHEALICACNATQICRIL